MKNRFTVLLAAAAVAITFSACTVSKAAESVSDALSETTTSSTPEITEETTAADTAQPSKIFERVPYEGLSDAEQIYASLNSLAEFEYYVPFELHADLDPEDVIYIEKLRLPTAGASDEDVGTAAAEPFFRIASGRMSNGVDLCEWIDSFAAGRYAAHELFQFFSRYFILSDNKIYVSNQITSWNAGWLTTSKLTLNDISVIDDSTIQLNFSYTDYAIGIGYSEPETAYMTITMDNGNGGWKIASYDSATCMIPLVNQFIRTASLIDNGEPDLLTQLEEYLAENPVS